MPVMTAAVSRIWLNLFRHTACARAARLFILGAAGRQNGELTSFVGLEAN